MAGKLDASRIRQQLRALQQERERLVRLVVQQIEYDGRGETLHILFREPRLQNVAGEMGDATKNTTL